MIVQPPINHEATGLFDTVRLFKPCLVGSQFPGPHSMHALSLQHTSCRTKVTPVGLREMSCFGNHTRPGPMAVAACRPSQDTRHLQALLVMHTCTCGYATVCYGNRGQLIEGRLEVKLPTVWTDKKKRWEDSEKRRAGKKREEKRRAEQSRGEERRGEEKRRRDEKRKSQEEKRSEEKRREEKESRRKKKEKRRKKKEEKRSEKRREESKRKKMQAREKAEKLRITPFFHWFVAAEGQKWVCESGGRGTVWPNERLKVAYRCGAKQISKSKVLKSDGLGPLLEVKMSKKVPPKWHEAHFEVKSVKVKNWLSRTTFGSWDVEKVHAVVARSIFQSPKC